MLEGLSSAPGHIHEPQNLHVPIAGKVMPLGLQVHGVDDGFPKLFIVDRMTPQNTAKINRVLVAQAKQQATFHSDPDPVTG